MSIEWLTLASTVLGGLIATITTAITQRHEFKVKAEKEYLNQIVKAYDDLSDALSRYNRDCIRITRYEVSLSNARDINTECQTAFFDIQYEFRKSELRKDTTLQELLKEMGELNIQMSNNVIETANSGTVGRIDNSFMEDLTGLEERINNHIWEMKRKTLLEKRGASPYRTGL